MTLFSFTMKFSLLVSIFPLISTVICDPKEDFEKFCKVTYGPEYTVELDTSGNPAKCVTSIEKLFVIASKDPADGKEKCCSGEKKPAVAFCHGKVACPTETDLGIQYGKCYVLSFPDGKQLGRQPNRAYEKAGRWQDIPFKVCSSTFDCKAGVPVGLKDSFSLQDQLGIPEDTAVTKGWINNFSGGSHKAFTPDKAQAAIFKGRPGCIGDGCSICINTDPKGLTIACPDALPGLTSVNNPNYCQRMIFEEVQCLS
jgi:hypothetical protein